MNMKITVSFEATSMANLKDQLLEAFGSISAGGGEIARTASQVKEIEKTGISPTFPNGRWDKAQSHIAAMQESMVKASEHIAFDPAVGIDKTVAWGPFDSTSPHQTLEDVLKAPNFPVPSFAEEKPAEQTHIDGHRVSNGSVWVPVEGRSNAFTGIPMERYLAQKAAKEAGGELDSKGVAWDAAIHTSTKVKTQSGEWKKRPVRGAVKETVEAAPAQQPVKVYIPPAPTTTQPVEMPFAPVAPTPVEPVIPVTESLAPAVGSAPDMYSFDSFKKGLGLAIVRLVNQKKIDQNDILALAQHFQVNDLFDLGKDAHTASCKILFDHFVNQGLIIGV